MTVKELVEALKNFTQDAKVVVADGDSLIEFTRKCLTGHMASDLVCIDLTPEDCSIISE